MKLLLLGHGRLQRLLLLLLLLLRLRLLLLLLLLLWVCYIHLLVHVHHALRAHGLCVRDWKHRCRLVWILLVSTSALLVRWLWRGLLLHPLLLLLWCYSLHAI